jgi:hypothetical protein
VFRVRSSERSLGKLATDKTTGTLATNTQGGPHPTYTLNAKDPRFLRVEIEGFARARGRGV